jgi:Fe-S-cluster containining protein
MRDLLQLFDLPELHSPAGKWCRHCAPGKGCKIYEMRPGTCRTFFCAWMVSAGLGPEWKPEHAKLIVQLRAIGDD